MNTKKIPVGAALPNSGFLHTNRALFTKEVGWLLMFLLVLLLVFTASLLMGRVRVPLYSDVVLQLRLPRALASLLIGAGLGTAGASMQGLFRNPLVSPSVLGISAGAGFGGALGIYLVPTFTLGILFLAFMGGFLAMLLTYGVVRKGSPITVVLVGMSMGALFTALTSIIKFAADPTNKLPSIVFLLMGGLSGISYQKLAFAAGPICLGVFGLLLARWRINVLSLGEAEAHTLGVKATQWRWWIIGCITLIVAASVSIAGVIGWVGLVVPHIARMIVGPDHRALIPASALLGAAYVILMDTLARSVAATEIPLSIFTTIIGAFVFLYLLSRAGVRSWGRD